MGEANAPAPVDGLTPGAERFASSLEMREGGRTMSRRAFGEVVSGWPPESRVSSRSCKTLAKFSLLNGVNKAVGIRTHLIYDIEVIFECSG